MKRLGGVGMAVSSAFHVLLLLGLVWTMKPRFDTPVPAPIEVRLIPRRPVARAPQDARPPLVRPRPSPTEAPPGVPRLGLEPAPAELPPPTTPAPEAAREPAPVPAYRGLGGCSDDPARPAWQPPCFSAETAQADAPHLRMTDHAKANGRPSWRCESGARKRCFASARRASRWRTWDSPASSRRGALDTPPLRPDRSGPMTAVTAEIAPIEPPVRRQLMRRVFESYLRPHLGGFVTALVCAALVGGLTAVLAWMLEPAVRRLLIEKDPDALVVLPLLIVAVGLLRGAAQFGQVILTNRIGNGLVADIQEQLFGHLLTSDLARLRSAHSGSYVASVLYDAGLIREAATTGVVNYVQNLLIVVGAMVVMLIQDPVLGGLVLVAAPVSVLVMRRFVKKTRSSSVSAMEETSALSTAVMESLDGIKIVKIENREAFERGRVADVIRRRLGHLVAASNAKALAAPTTDVLVTVVIAAVIAYAGWRAQYGAMDLSNLLSFLVALTLAGQALRGLANFQTVMTEGLTAAHRLFDVLDVRPEIADAPDAADLPAGDSTIRLEDVRFAYDGRAPALNGVTLEARRGQTVALVGPSGGGKSTILNLIPRFYDVGEGRLTIDGRDVRTATLTSLRARIGLVTQEPFLFDDTIRANIAYARPDAREDEIVAAAKAAAADEFIGELPKGYDTQVGEAGARMSGGQRQRISIARAFLKDAPILLLDEATSALDTESEARVQEALERLMVGRTTLLIAHRLSTVRGADLIYVIDRGRVVEQGGHDELMAAGGLYARLARSQDLETEAA